MIPGDFRELLLAILDTAKRMGYHGDLLKADVSIEDGQGKAVDIAFEREGDSVVVTGSMHWGGRFQK